MHRYASAGRGVCGSGAPRLRRSSSGMPTSPQRWKRPAAELGWPRPGTEAWLRPRRRGDRDDLSHTVSTHATDGRPPHGRPRENASRYRQRGPRRRRHVLLVCALSPVGARHRTTRASESDTHPYLASSHARTFGPAVCHARTRYPLRSRPHCALGLESAARLL